MKFLSRFTTLTYAFLVLLASACDSDNEPGTSLVSYLTQLKSIGLSAGVLSPQFAPDIREYDVMLSRDNYAITVNTLPRTLGADIEMFVNGNKVDSTFPLQVGLNRLVIRVSFNKKFTEYVVNIEREALRITTIDTVTLQPGAFEILETTSGFEFVYGDSMENVDMQIALDDSLATAIVFDPVFAATYSDHIPLRPGINRLQIIVTADDRETTRIYDLTITRNPWILVNEQAPFSQRDGLLLVEFKGKLWMFGGYPFNPPNNIHVWVSSDGENWEYAATPPTELLRHAVTPVVYKDKIWVISGDGKNDVWNSADGVNWTQIATDLPWGNRYSPYLFSFKGKLWLMGGFSWWDESGTFVLPDGVPPEGFNDVWTSEDGITWEKVLDHAPWAPRGMTHGSIVFNNRMWIIGGGIKDADTIEAYNDVWSSEDGLVWEQMPDAPWERRYHFSAAVFENKIWITDGSVYPRQSNMSNEVWFTEDGRTWTELKGTPWPARHASGLVSFQNKLLLLGGMGLDGITRNDIWKLNPGNTY